MNMGNRGRLKKAALELEQLAKGMTYPEDALMFLMDMQEAIITVQRDLVFRPDANQPGATQQTPKGKRR